MGEKSLLNIGIGLVIIIYFVGLYYLGEKVISDKKDERLKKLEKDLRE